MRLPFVWISGLAVLFSSVDLLADAPAPTFERDIRPILVKRCNGCHNTVKRNDLEVSGGLALDSFEQLMKGTISHKVIGKTSANSELYQRLISSNEEKRMPLFDRPLTDIQRDLIRRWLDAGAPQGAPVSTTDLAPVTRVARPFHPTLDVSIPVDPRRAPAALKVSGSPTSSAVLKVGPLPAVTALAFHPDGRSLVTGLYRRVVFWDLRSLRPVRTIGPLVGPVHSVVFSPDGKLLAIGTGEPGRTGQIDLVEFASGRVLKSLAGHSDVVFGLAIRPDGGQLASVSFDHKVKFWTLPDGKPSGSFEGHSDFVYDVSYSPDGKSVVTCGKDKTVKRIDTKTFQEIRTYSDHNDEVLTVAARPDGSGFVSAGNEPQIRWWNLTSEKPDRRLNGHGGPVHELAVSRNGASMISASGDKSVRLWDPGSGKAIKTLLGGTDWQYSVALSDDAKLAAAGGWDGLTRIWDTESSSLRATLLLPHVNDPKSTEWAAFLPGGEVLGSKATTQGIHWNFGAKRINPASPDGKVLLDEAVFAKNWSQKPSSTSKPTAKK